jgi:hypothetical protein
MRIWATGDRGKTKPNKHPLNFTAETAELAELSSKNTFSVFSAVLANSAVNRNARFG